jgi:hypothetical protein
MHLDLRTTVHDLSTIVGVSGSKPFFEHVRSLEPQLAARDKGFVITFPDGYEVGLYENCNLIMGSIREGTHGNASEVRDQKKGREILKKVLATFA